MSKNFFIADSKTERQGMVRGTVLGFMAGFEGKGLGFYDSPGGRESPVSGFSVGGSGAGRRRMGEG
jgi:hypothetical protein